MSKAEVFYTIFSVILVLLYSLFAPEALFYKCKKEEKHKLFGRWKYMRLAWNIHQSFIHFIGSFTGVIALWILFFRSNIDWSNLTIEHFSIEHLILLIIGLAGIMGFIPKILFGFDIPNFSESKKKTKS